MKHSVGLAVCGFVAAMVCTALMEQSLRAAEEPIPVDKFDVAVYGATPAGVSAAVNAAREGCRVVFVERGLLIGGMMAGGLSWPDFKSMEALGGTYREYMQRIERHYAATYGSTSQEVIDCVKGAFYEPHVVEAVFREMLDESGVDVRLGWTLVDATVEPAGDRSRLVRAEFEDRDALRRAVEARVFIDATYEGDLMAMAGVPYVVGCESKDQYGESLAFDEPNSYVQTYNFRICLTKDPSNRIATPKPEGYLREDFLDVLDYWRQGRIQSVLYEIVPRTSKPMMKARPIGRGKADFNDIWQSPVSLSIENVNHPWPNGTWAQRQEIYDVYKQHSLGLLWFLQNDPQVPADWREEIAPWGLPRDEYPESGHWSPQLYVREARRMVGEYVYTENDTANHPESPRSKLHPDAVAICDYAINSHGVYSPEPGEVIGHGAKIVSPIQIPFGVMLPRDLDGLLVPVAVSSSHVGYCALRYEAAWTALAQAAGIAAAKAVKQRLAARQVDINDLQRRLHEVGAITCYVSDLADEIEIPQPSTSGKHGSFRSRLLSVPPENRDFQAAQYFATKGFLHELEKEKRGTRGEPQCGQWHSAFTFHELKPQEPISRELAERWFAMASALGVHLDETNPKRLTQQASTRGEFLRTLFERLPPAGPSR